MSKSASNPISYKCSLCNKCYSSSTNRNRHSKTCTGNQKDQEIAALKKQLQNLKATDATVIMTNQLSELKQQIAAEVAKELEGKIAQIGGNVTNNITSNVTNNINIYFNKDLKYYPELVKIMGKKGTCDYLLFTMPESKDLFGALDKIFVQNGVSTCPIKLDGNEFMIARNEGQYDHDPTGEIIDKENKYKLQDAVMSAYIDSTKHFDEECNMLRLKRANGEYSKEDEEILNRRYEFPVEPSRPYDVIEIMNNIKPKKKDFDKLKKICPTVTKKIV